MISIGRNRTALILQPHSEACLEDSGLLLKNGIIFETFDDIEMWDWMFAHYVSHPRALLPERRDKFFTTVV
jgi:hypothetical protein